MAGVPALTPPRTPLQSLQFGQLLGRRSSHDLSSPPCIPSSPLNPYSSGKAQRFRTSDMSNNPPPDRRASYKARKPAYSLAPVPEPPRDALLRGRMKAKCAARMAHDRSKAKDGKRKAYQSSSSDAGNSSDVDMDDDEGDELDDELYLRVMTSEKQREVHRNRYLYENQVGSSFDPDIEDMDAWEYEDDLPDDEEPPEDFDDDALAEYEAYMENQGHNVASSQPSSNESPDMPEIVEGGSQGSITSRAEESRNGFLNHLLLHTSCPQCRAKTLSISQNVDSAIACSSCQTTFPLANAAHSWVDDHPRVEDGHQPTWSLDPFDPSAILLECSSSNCVWLSGL